MAYLRSRMLAPILVREKPEPGLLSRSITLARRSRVKPRELVLFTRQFAAMIDAGLPLTQALEILARQTESPALKTVSREMLYEIESGNTLAGALAKHPKVFKELYVNMVAAGEAGSLLDTTLSSTAAFLEKSERIRRSIRGAMIYPAVILSVAAAAIATMVLFVIPTFEGVFASFNAVLPLPTRMVVSLSRAFQSYWWAIPVAGTGALILLRRWISTDRGRLRFDRVMLALPVVGPLVLKAAVARFTRTLGTLLSSGVPILDGLEITARTAGNRVVHDAVLASGEAVAGGDSVGETLKASGAFPPMVSHMIHVGEETGDLDGMLSKIADFYDDEVAVAVESLLKIVEPALVVILGVVVGGMIIAMYLPIFDLVNAIH